MSRADSAVWISCYIYYDAKPDELLTGDIWPFVQSLQKAGLLRQFFFIRYADEKGLHIRLRLLPEPTAAQKVRRRARAKFPEAEFVAYMPETERYGGPQGVPIAEQLFDASSAAVLRLLAADASWNYGRALASAMQMHIGMLQAFGVGRAEATALFEHIAQSEQQTFDVPVLQLEQAFESQRATVVSPLSTLWDACEKGVPFSDAWFARWRTAAQPIAKSLHRIFRAGQLQLPKTSSHPNPLWALYESYVHMTNNRLGLARPDECLAAYLLHRSLSGL